jgi:hypothetical protein
MKIRNIASSEPFACIAIDLLLGLDEDEKGHKGILTVLDSYTRFVELIPITDKKATTIAAALLSIFGRYGQIQSIKHDKGKEFHNELISAYLKLLKIKDTPSIPYRSESDGAVERANESAQQHLRKLVLEDPTLKPVWYLSLPMIQRLMNTTTINVTDPIDQQVTPIELMYAGRAPKDNRLFSVLDEGVLDLMSETNRERVSELIEIQNKLMNIHDKYQKERLRHRAKKGPAADERKYQEGQYVLLAYPDKRKPPKLEPRLTGPYVVIQNDNPDSSMVNLRDITDGREFSAHGERIRLYTGKDPMETAKKTKSGEYVIDHIKNHRLRKLKKTTKDNPNHYEFLVAWENFDPEWDTWEKFSTLRKAEALDDYLATLENPPACLMGTDD